MKHYGGCASSSARTTKRMERIERLTLKKVHAGAASAGWLN
jgi:hypothetical protein